MPGKKPTKSSSRTVKKTPARTTSRSSTSSGSYVKFSDKLTDSLNDISKMIGEHKDMIDSIQDVALELTTAIGSLHTLTVKYAGKINQILDILLPIIKGLPIIPDKVEKLLIDLEKWTQRIIDNKEQTSSTISDVQSGLHSGDLNKLKAHSKDLKKVTKTITAIVPKT
jgi:methyl-accepting chemotaxis protein